MSGDEIDAIAAWADAGAPQGDPADLPPPRVWADRGKWSVGTPDLVISSPVSTVEALAPDWYGMVNPPSPTGLTEDRWIKAVEIKEVIVDDAGREVVPAIDGTAGGARPRGPEPVRRAPFGHQRQAQLGAGRRHAPEQRGR